MLRSCGSGGGREYREPGTSVPHLRKEAGNRGVHRAPSAASCVAFPGLTSALHPPAAASPQSFWARLFSRWLLAVPGGVHPHSHVAGGTAATLQLARSERTPALPRSSLLLARIAAAVGRGRASR